MRMDEMMTHEKILTNIFFAKIRFQSGMSSFVLFFPVGKWVIALNSAILAMKLNYFFLQSSGIVVVINKGQCSKRNAWGGLNG